ncbi:MAG: (d)CMP kinase [Deltaproteobacteria bacterium]|nr:(d)CMP kinase [Deltaproteobacteria bacterium]MBW1923824.1 (d)CMP kinase [Deltaproteobacteria bacterium]MBW1948541.1 (d)CMP kinase [Deltaproteobacteria bacterium]MBW2006969.1 (d)CMP kinase [Deltaproteobacteria bacterium]MBW2347560.1 (d)CMP kinase [Deltaproteobacteria bacterium]
MPHIVTIDGPAGSGKSTVARLAAKRLGFVYLDTGAMYRAVAFAARKAGIAETDARALGDLCRVLDLRFEASGGRDRLFLGAEEITDLIRTPEMDMHASRVSAVGAVREAMTALQRKMAACANVVAEGRDMGTVVFPDAAYKFFLTASPKIRAERRYRERLARGEEVSFDEVAEDLALRDRQDQSRALAPLRPAPDAVRIDTGGLTPEQVVERILARVDLCKDPPGDGLCGTPLRTRK